MKGRWFVLSILGTLILSSALFADTCAQVVGATPRVNGTFKFTVLDINKNPRAGVHVDLGTIDRYNAMHPISSGTTDANGVLNFVNLKAGNFTFQMTDNTGERQYFDVQIVSDGGDPTAVYMWPFVNWLSLRSGSGILMSGSEPLRHWHVTLEGFPDGNELGFGDTDASGAFDLPAGKPGRYYIELSQSDSNSGSNYSLGRVPISVTMDEKYPAADAIFVENSECGIKYDQFCTLPPETIENSCIQTVDANGKALTTAHARLFSQRGAVGTTNISSDSDGNIKLPRLSAGDYQLQIFAHGYTPIRRFITVTPGAASCEKPMVIPMNALGYGCVIATPPPGKGN
jgi:uncharacterized surface anchored protein